MIDTVVAATVAGAFSVGLLFALLGSIKLTLAKRLDLSEDRVGSLLSALHLALIPMMLVSGILSDQIGVRGAMLLGSLIAAGALFILGTSTTYRTAFAAVFLVGAGAALLSAGSIILMPRAFYQDNTSAALNLGNVFFGLGAILAPPLAEFVLNTLEPRRAFGGLALACLVPAILVGLTDAELLKLEGDSRGLQVVLQDPVIWLAGLVFLFYSPVEGSLGIWSTTYLTELGVQERVAMWLLSAFWLMFLLARLLTAYLMGQGWIASSVEPWYVLALALIAAIALGNLAGAAFPGKASLGLLMVGALLGPIFPTLVGMLFQSVEGRECGTAYGAMFALGSFGGLVFPPLVARRVRLSKSVRGAMTLPVSLALAMALAAFVLALSLPTLRQP